MTAFLWEHLQEIKFYCIAIGNTTQALYGAAFKIKTPLLYFKEDS